MRVGAGARPRRPRIPQRVLMYRLRVSGRMADEISGLGVNFWAYLQDRVRGLGQIPRLATLIRQKGEELSACKEGATLPNGAGGGVVV